MIDKTQPAASLTQTPPAKKKRGVAIQREVAVL